MRNDRTVSHRAAPRTRQASKYVHFVGDGKDAEHRQVLLDGRKIEWVVFADTRRGVVRCVRAPFRLDKWGKRLLTRTLRGRVEVQFLRKQP